MIIGYISVHIYKWLNNLVIWRFACAAFFGGREKGRWRERERERERKRKGGGERENNIYDVMLSQPQQQNCE